MQEPAANSGPEGGRDDALSEVLSAYAEPRAVSYRFVLGFVLAGLTGCAALAWFAAQIPARRPLRFEPEQLTVLERGIAAFDRGEWDEAERLLNSVRPQSAHAAARWADYRDRIALIRRDDERLELAERALAEGDAARALQLTGLIGSNSALFAHAEVLSRTARAKVSAAVQASAQTSAPVAAASDAAPASRRGAAAENPRAQGEPRPPQARAQNRAQSSFRARSTTRQPEDAW